MVDFSRGACIASCIKSIKIRSLFRAKTCTKKEQVKYCRVAFFLLCTLQKAGIVKVPLCIFMCWSGSVFFFFFLMYSFNFLGFFFFYQLFYCAVQQISNEILHLMETVYYKLGHLDPFLLWFPNQSIKFMFAPMRFDLIVHSSRQTKLQSDHLSCGDWLNSKL